MSFPISVSGARCVRASVSMPEARLWFGNFQLDEPKVFARGAAVTVAVGDVSLAGYVVDGGPFAEVASYRVAAGFGGWKKTVKARSYESGSVKLSTVLRDLAVDCGERWALGFGVGFIDRVLGQIHVRPEGPAAHHLNGLLGAAWYVGDDGLTVAAARPASVAKAELIDFDPTLGTVDLETETPSKVRPGSLFTSGSTSLVISCVDAFTGDRVGLRGWGRA